MGIARVASRAQLGLAAPRVEVEVHLGSGLPTFSIVGLPATAVKESKDRVRAALANSGFEFPAGRITVNLSPADLPKEGCRYDLPIALGILLASSQIRFDEASLAETEFYGELGLAGELKPVKGVLLAAAHARRESRRVVVPAANLAEARLAAPAAAHGRGNLARSLRCGRWRRAPDDTAVRGHAVGRAPAETRPISPTCGVRRLPSARWSSRPPADTASCWSGRLAPARACSRNACRDCSRRSMRTRRSTWPRSHP